MEFETAENLFSILYSKHVTYWYINCTSIQIYLRNKKEDVEKSMVTSLTKQC